MIKSVSFQNFMGFKNLALPGLSPITLFSGKNNSGKSTVLDGIFLIMNHSNPKCFCKLCSFREGQDTPSFDILWRNLFYQLNVDKNIRISAQLEYSRNGSYSPLQQNINEMTSDVMNLFMFSKKNGYDFGFKFTQKEICYTETGHFVENHDRIVVNMDTRFTNNKKIPMPLTQIIDSTILPFQYSVEIFEKLEKEGRKSEILDILKKMDSTISDITTITINGQTQLYVNMREKLFPMRLVGNGMNSFLIIMLSIIGNPNSIILIDEIENGLHYSMYPIIWDAIANAVQKSNCQVIATTHSYECVVGAVDGVEKADMKNDFCFFRLAQGKNGRVAYRYSKDLLKYALESDLEVR